MKVMHTWYYTSVVPTRGMTGRICTYSYIISTLATREGHVRMLIYMRSTDSRRDGHICTYSYIIITLATCEGHVRMLLYIKNTDSRRDGHILHVPIHHNYSGNTWRSCTHVTIHQKYRLETWPSHIAHTHTWVLWQHVKVMYACYYTS
jgi:hypothetical protein